DFSWGMTMESQIEDKTEDGIEYAEDKFEAETEDEPHDKPVNPHATTDEEWKRVAVYFESKQKDRAAAKNQRELIDAMLWVIKTGSLWKDLPPEYGAWKTVYNKYANLRKTDAWGKILQELNMTSKLTLKIKFEFNPDGDDED
ncbi:MAG: transposase, partial [Synergistaceae bacterium]|nr:transposase [Synergistaceae bacterium]